MSVGFARSALPQSGFVASCFGGHFAVERRKGVFLPPFHSEAIARMNVQLILLHIIW